MTARSWFGVGVRLIGLWEVLYGADEVVMMFAMALGRYHPAAFQDTGGIFIFAMFHIVLGAFLLKAAPLIAAWQYPDPAKLSNDRADV